MALKEINQVFAFESHALSDLAGSQKRLQCWNTQRDVEILVDIVVLADAAI